MAAEVLDFAGAPGAMRRYRSARQVERHLVSQAQLRTAFRAIKGLDLSDSEDSRFVVTLLRVYAGIIVAHNPDALASTSLESVRTTIAVDRLLLAAGGGHRG